MAPRVIAALLSFVWPGLGQGWAGSRHRALMFAVPMMLLLGAGLLVMIVQGKARSLGLLLQPEVLLLLFALNLAVLIYRLVAILVDALGGLDMTTKDSIYDAGYPDPLSTRDVTLYISRGIHHFDGWHSLAYARSRHQDNDYNRMNRQQEVLLALHRQINPCTLITRILELLDIAKDSLWTNIPIERLPDLLEIGARVRPGTIARYQFWPPDIHEDLDAQSINRVRLMVRTAFFGTRPSVTPAPSSSSMATPAPGSGSSC